MTEIRPKVNVIKSEPKLGPGCYGQKLNDLKVIDLRAECKKRNLPVSGPKPTLIERLKSSDSNLQDEAISSSSTSASVAVAKNTTATAADSMDISVVCESEPLIKQEKCDDSKSCITTMGGPLENVIVVDAKILREQESTIEQLQQALINSQNQLINLKSNQQQQQQQVILCLSCFFPVI